MHPRDIDTWIEMDERDAKAAEERAAARKREADGVTRWVEMG